MHLLPALLRTERVRITSYFEKHSVDGRWWRCSRPFSWQQKHSVILERPPHLGLFFIKMVVLTYIHVELFAPIFELIGINRCGVCDKKLGKELWRDFVNNDKEAWETGDSAHTWKHRACKSGSARIECLRPNRRYLIGMIFKT